jgi:hypothetical protein
MLVSTKHRQVITVASLATALPFDRATLYVLDIIIVGFAHFGNIVAI